MTLPSEAVESVRNAGIVSRGAAGIVDVIVVGVILGAIYVGLALTRMIINPTGFQLPHLSAVFSTAVTVSCAIVYLTGCWALSGCTVGAVVLGVRVLGRSSERIPPVVALLRAVACVLFPIGLAWVVVDRNRRSIQDRVLGTRVVYVR